MEARESEFDRLVRATPDGTASAARAETSAPAPHAHESAPVGSRFDERWERWMADPRIRRAWTWGAPAAVIGVAAATRLIGLDNPHAIVFDETYYVKDAWTLSQLGYESRWADDANESFLAGDPNTYLRDASFVVHPPLGKWIIAAGMALFGTDSGFGWRVGMAVVGVLLVALTMLVAKRLFASTTLAVLAGALIAIDGNAIVMCRVAVLDTGVAFFGLLGAYFVLLDRDWFRIRLAAALESRGSPWGPTLWWRPWLIAAAVAFGCATSVKWSGLYFLAVFGIFTVVSDAFLRKQAGIELWAVGALLKQAPVNFVSLVPLAAVTHMLTWWSWFATDGGYSRRWVEEQGGTRWEGLLAWVPVEFQNWWHFQSQVWGYHVSESTPHPYQANPLTWLFLVRPTSMFYQDHGDGTASAILDIANPLIWWGATAALGFLVVRVVRGLMRSEPVWADAFILTGMAAGYLPWLMYLNRTVFQFYTIAFEPFMVLALTAAIAAIVGRRDDPERLRVPALVTGTVFLVLVLIVSAFFLPMWTGQPMPVWFIRMHYWLPGWF
ncbi:dolichyl-phosphate-mannose--protein mannosyltransferase [Salinibacterium sp. ZJ70]|uniref:dolichyl-phosphate-mannose--protein mannosyltransferase n=1 Tax=Salinibacterium sp. ZJ70 TaxID=2708084 RepID=UPI00142164D5|nr:phospholipid carrier-dependent glycosyltransferase [Salinibacterium sp. ZJ70]